MDLWSAAPSGVYKSHQMSNDLREAAIARTVVMPFVGIEDGSGKKVGESVTVSRVSNIAVPSDARLTESDEIPQDDITMTTTSVTMVEWGRSVTFSNFREALDKFDPKNKIQRQLIRQMRLVLDNEAASAMLSSSVKVKAIPSGSSAITFDTDGVASTTATNNVNYFHIERIRDYMMDTLLVPSYYDDGEYACIGNTQFMRGIKDSPGYESWNKYQYADRKAKSEVGRLEQCRFIETNNTTEFSKNLGSNSDLGEGVFFGEDFITIAVAEDPHLRVQLNKNQDYGRTHGCAWYGIFEFLVVWDTATAGEGRGVHVTSA